MHDIERLSEGEARLIEALAERSSSQRILARAAGLSLGMTNILIKRLVKKGLIKVVTLNGRTLSYMLTPRGFAEKVKRTYEYITVSIRFIDRVRSNILSIVAALPEGSPLYIAGPGELAQLAAETLRESGRVFEQVNTVADLEGKIGVCLVCLPEMPVPIPPGLIVKSIVA